MSVKQLETIPNEPKAKTAKQMAREDIEYAISHKMHTFEFIGDYNYKYLGSYAREVADGIFHSQVYNTARLKVCDKLRKELGVRYIFPPSFWEYRGRYITIIQHKEDDRVHVYGKIDYKFAEKFEEILEQDTRVRYKETEERKRYREERADSEA